LVEGRFDGEQENLAKNVRCGSEETPTKGLRQVHKGDLLADESK
jgi:hypothetical protein